MAFYPADPVDVDVPPEEMAGHFSEFDAISQLTNPVTFTSTLESGKIKVQFSEDVLETVALVTTSNYTITPPVGSPAVTVTGVEAFDDYVLLTLSVTETKNGGTYQVALIDGIARAVATIGDNAATSATFSGSSTPPVVTYAIPRSIGDGMGAIRVLYSKDMDMATATNPLNYGITWASGTLTIIGVTQVSVREVEIVTAPQALVVYTLAISGVKDLIGNELV